MGDSIRARRRNRNRYGGLAGCHRVWSNDGQRLARRQGLGAWGNCGVMITPEWAGSPRARYMRGTAISVTGHASPVPSTAEPYSTAL